MQQTTDVSPSNQHDVRRWLYLSVALVCLAISGAIVTTYRLTVEPAPIVYVRWREGLPEPDRRDREEQFWLAGPEAVDEGTLAYEVVDPSSSNIEALVKSPDATDTHFIDRQTYEIEAIAPLGPPRTWIVDRSPTFRPFSAVFFPLAGWLAFVGVGLILFAERRYPLAVWRWMYVRLVLPDMAAPASPPAERLEPRHWQALAAAQIVLITVLLGYWLFQAEFPYIDAFRTLDYSARRTWSGLWTDFFSGWAEFRPLYFAAVKLVQEVAGGPSRVAFRAVQVSVVTLDLALLMAVLWPRTPATWAGFTGAACCFVGLHTAMDNLTTSQPLPYGTAVIAMVLGTLLLLRRKPSFGVDAAAAVMSATAVLLVEYGLAVGLMWLAAGLSRWGAARLRTAALSAAGLGLYGTLRMLTNSNPLPGSFYLATGYLFQDNVAVEELRLLFEGREWMFRGYNIAAHLFTVFFSEPRAGVYYAFDALLNGARVQPWQVVNWVTSLLSTLLIALFMAGWHDRNAEERRTIALGAIVILSNCLMGYMYTRDRLPVVAGAYYAVLVGWAISAAWQRRWSTMNSIRRNVLTVVCLMVLVGWGYRLVGTVVWARDQAWSVRDEWTVRYERLQPPPMPGTPVDDDRSIALRDELRRRALDRPLADPHDDPAWMWTLFERKGF